MTTVRSIPVVPLRSRPATFSPDMESLLSNLPGWTAEVNALGNETNANKVIAVNSAATATTKALEAAASAAAALSSGAKWVSGTTYAQGAAVWSPIDFFIYRRKVAGAGTIDPSADGVNWTRITTPFNRLAYDSRSSLRAMTPKLGDLYLVESLGLFRWDAVTTEPDDDETCFKTASGSWLIELAHADLIEAWASLEEEEQDAGIDELNARVDAAEARLLALETNKTRILHGTATSSITSVGPLSQASFTGVVVGAAVGDRVIATPPDDLSAKISFSARVSSANTVRVTLNNTNTLSSASLDAGTWNLSVIKEI